MVASGKTPDFGSAFWGGWGIEGVVLLWKVFAFKKGETFFRDKIYDSGAV